MTIVAELLVSIKKALENAFPWTKPILRRLSAKVFAVLLVLGISGSAVWTFWDSAPIKEIRQYISQKSLPHATSDKFAIAVAHIEGEDAARTVEKQLVDALMSLKQGGIEILRFDRITKTQDEGKPEEAIASEQIKVRSWLKESGAHVVLWGQYIGGAKQSVRIHITARDAEESRNLRLDNEQVIELPVAAKNELETAIRLQVLSQLGRFRSTGRFVADQIAQSVQELKVMIDASEPGEPKAAMQNALGIALIRQGEQQGNSSLLLQSTEYFKAASTVYTRERAPLQWAATQNNLGSALQTLGERESGAAKLEYAVTAYRNALLEYTRERAPLQWAATQNNLGSALQTLGERESGTAKLEEAITAYRNALQGYTRERAPLEWAATQNNLGAALQSLGERESGTAKLEEAVSAYRNALQEYTRERVPLDWAMTQNNLGIALRSLGERENDTAKLEEAVTAYRNALQERTRARVPLDWAATQNSLGAALGILGERESGTAKLEESEIAFRNALQERTRERVPLDWAGTQNNLGLALTSLGERESGTAKLEEAVAAYKAALSVYTEANASYYVEIARKNLDKVQQVIARRKKQ